MKIDKTNAGHWALLLLQGLYASIAALLRPFRPHRAKPLITLYGHQFNGNLRALYRQWQDQWQERMELRVLCLNPAMADALEAQGIQILRCHRLPDMLVVGTSAAIISDHGPHLLTPLLRFTSIKFVDVWHGIPFKGFVPHDFRAIHPYDETWVSSDLLRELYIEKFGFRAEQVLSLGYARTDPLFREPPAASAYFNSTDAPAHGKVILYAPTWQQDERGRDLFPFNQSQAEFLDALEGVCAKHDATLIVRAHQNAVIAEDRRDHVIFCSQLTYPDTEDLLLAASILICDWSSIAFDFLALNRPTLFLDVPPPFRHGFSLGADYRFGHIATDMPLLLSGLDKYLRNPDAYLRNFGEKHQEITSQLYEESSIGCAAQKQLTHLSSLLGTS